MRTCAIVNPASGRRKTSSAWPALLEKLGARGKEIDTFWSEYSGHAEKLAASARRKGYERVVAVGGDGTLSQVVNGLWWEAQGRMPSVGMAPFGTGCDYIRNYATGVSRLDKLRSAIGEPTQSVSLGLCRFRNVGGVTERVYPMVLGLGFDAEVIRRFLYGRFSDYGWCAYVLSALAELRNPKTLTLKGMIDGESFSSKGVFFAAAVGRYFGKGIKIAPDASPVNDTFEWILVEPARRLGLLYLACMAYFGAHKGRQGIKTGRAARISIEANPTAWIEVDGELVGKAPVEIEIIPNAIRFAASGIISPVQAQ